jgi:hypothetical protein
MSCVPADFLSPLPPLELTETPTMPGHADETAEKLASRRGHQVVGLPSRYSHAWKSVRRCLPEMRSASTSSW